MGPKKLKTFKEESEARPSQQRDSTTYSEDSQDDSIYENNEEAKLNLIRDDSQAQDDSNSENMEEVKVKKRRPIPDAKPIHQKKTTNFVNCISIMNEAYKLFNILILLFVLMKIMQNNDELNLSISRIRGSLENLKQRVQVLQSDSKFFKEQSEENTEQIKIIIQSLNNIVKSMSMHGTSSNKQVLGSESETIPIDTGASGSRVEIPSSRDLIRNLKNDFPNQFSETWGELYSGITKSLEENPSHPTSIFIMVSPQMQTEEFSKCFVERLGSDIHKISQSSTINFPKEKSSDEMNVANYDDLKNELEMYFNNGGRLVVFHDVNQITNKSILMLLHALMDNRNSINPNAIFISTAIVPENIYTKYEEKYEWIPEKALQISREVLRTEWSKTLERDDITPLISRLAINVVVLNNDNCK